MKEVYLLLAVPDSTKTEGFSLITHFFKLSVRTFKKMLCTKIKQRESIDETEIRTKKNFHADKSLFRSGIIGNTWKLTRKSSESHQEYLNVCMITNTNL